MKYIMKHKKILLISIVLVIVTSMFLVLNNSQAYKELPKVKLKDNIKNNGLAIMIESDYQTGEYQQSDSTVFPTDGYTLNRIKSGCVDKNGNSVDALTYNDGNNGITIKTKQSVYCYLYYDNLFKGLGTEDEPYQINYIEDLVRLSNSVNKDLNVYKNKNFMLMQNLDFNENDSYMKYNDTGFGDINGVNNIEGIKDELTNKEGTGFVPIGNTATHFQGNFNGNNKRLDNIYILNKEGYDYLVGLFGSVENSTIKNLTISGSLNSNFSTRVGGLVGFSYGETTIDNCVNEINSNSIGGSNSVGGLVGDAVNNLTIKNSINKGQVSGGNNTGGLIGYTNGTLTIENSYNEGIINNEVAWEGNVGGLLGRDNSSTDVITIKNSYNAGKIINAKTAEGGLVGKTYGTIEIDNSHNEGEISNTIGSIVGGLIGYGVDTSNIIINNSYNNNEVSINTPEEKNISIGGFIGDSLGNVNINNCYNTGNIINERLDYAAGSFSGKVLNLGGFIGQLEGNKNTIIKNSYNSGEILNGNFSGGFVGNRSSTSNSNILLIEECYNIGKIDNITVSGWQGANGGGLVGVNRRKLYVLNCYNNAEVNSSYQASGLIGDTADAFTYVVNSYNAGSINGMKSYNSGISSTHFKSSLTYYANNVYNSGILNETTNFNYGLGYFNQTLATNIKNAYYLNNAIGGTNLENDAELTTPMVESDMKNKTFVDTLNKNTLELNNAGLETIDENLKGYELEKWIKGSEDYPILIRKIIDLSGQGNHGTSYAVKYDKEGITTSTDENHLGYIDAGLRGHDFGNNFTMVLKFKFNSILDYNDLLGNWETGGMGISVRNINGTMTITEAIYTDKYYSFTKPYDFKENEWYTIVLTYDGTLTSDNLKVYINGVLHDTVNVTGDVKIPAGDTIVAFGGNPKATWIQGQYSYATYKEALIFDKALTEEKDHISTNYKDDINVTNQDELLLWYKF